MFGRGGGGMGGMMGGRGAGARAQESTLNDTAETIYVSSLALLKMLIHGRAGIPLEVMGIMIGEFIDEYTVRVVDVFNIPQTATGQSVEAVDDEYQVAMMNKLAAVGRPETMVGWYHSHPGFGCWLSGMDVETARTFEQQSQRSVSVVIDPIQSVRGKVVIDAFRCIPQPIVASGKEPRQTTSNVGFMNKGGVVAVVNGLNRLYYNMPITYRKNQHEISMLLNVHKRGWRESMKIEDPVEHHKAMKETVAKLGQLANQATAFVLSGKDEDDVGNVGKLNPISHLALESDTMLSDSLDQSIGSMVNAVVF